LLLSQLNRAPCSCWQDYRKARGSQKRGDRSADGRDERRIELRIANAETRLVLFTPEGHENRVGTFFNGSFACDDVEATYRQLKQRGVEFLHEPKSQPWGTYTIFKDPDGNQFVMGSK
jgi:predicted enzyme related to lactoylglutathione lyase